MDMATIATSVPIDICTTATISFQRIGSNDKIRIHYCDPFPSVQDGIHDGLLLVPADPNTCG
jgi:hypothetical protein